MCQHAALPHALIPALIGLWVGAAGPTPAQAYVPARDAETGKAVRWRKEEIVFVPTTSRGISAKTLSTELQRAAAAWTSDVGCAHLRIRVEPPSKEPLQARRDGVNAVLVHEARWCRGGGPARFSCYHPDEQAMTTTYLGRDDKTGDVWIEEADIEINAVHYRWRGEHLLSDLLVHELGHVIGLAHDCDDGLLFPGATDHAGHAPKRCTTREGLRAAAMAPDPPPEGTRLVLAPDERRAVCELYATQVKATPTQTPQCACTPVQGPRSASIPGLVVLGTLLMRRGTGNRRVRWAERGR